MGAIASSRKWSLDSWRGGLGGSTVFDESLHPWLLDALARRALANRRESVPRHGINDKFDFRAGHGDGQRRDKDFRHQYPGHSKRGKAMYFEGEALMQLNRHAEAYPLFIDLLADQPTGPYAKQALFRAAESAVVSGKNAEAEIRLSQFQAQYPADKLNANIMMFRGELALQSIARRPSLVAKMQPPMPLLQLMHKTFDRRRPRSSVARDSRRSPRGAAG
jgi:hypothetical protein